MPRGQRCRQRDQSRARYVLSAGAAYVEAPLQPGNLATTIVGLGFIAGGVYAYVALGDALARSSEVHAIVVDVVYETGTMQKGRMHPVVRFNTPEGKEVVGRSEKHHNVKAGDTVAVVYDRANPASVEVGTLAGARRKRLFLSGVAVAFGSALSLGALALETGWLRPRRSPE